MYDRDDVHTPKVARVSRYDFMTADRHNAYLHLKTVAKLANALTAVMDSGLDDETTNAILAVFAKR